MTCKEWYAYSVEHGLCVVCHKPSDNGKRYCSSCAAKAKKRNAEQRAAYLEKGICPICRTNDLVGGEKACGECRAKRAKQDRKRNSERANYFAKRRRDRLKQEGRCISCGKPLDDIGYTTCSACRDKRRRRYEETRSVHRNKWIANGRCYICGSRDLADGHKLCEDCYKRSVKTAELMRQGKKKRKCQEDK